MPITNYLCYEPGVTSEKTAVPVPGWRPGGAAKCYARQLDDAGNFEDLRRIAVRNADGVWLHFEVIAEMTVVYDDTEVDPEPKIEPAKKK